MYKSCHSCNIDLIQITSQVVKIAHIVPQPLNLPLVSGQRGFIVQRCCSGQERFLVAVFVREDIGLRLNTRHCVASWCVVQWMCCIGLLSHLCSGFIHFLHKLQYFQPTKLHSNTKSKRRNGTQMLHHIHFGCLNSLIGQWR